MILDPLDIPDALLEAQEQGRLVVFVGAGVSRGSPSDSVNIQFPPGMTVDSDSDDDGSSGGDGDNEVDAKEDENDNDFDDDFDNCAPAVSGCKQQEEISP